jgi:predicted kinase
VVDNTNVLKNERAAYIEQARSAGFRVVGYYFQSRLQEALERNRQRIGKANIPEKGLIARYSQLQVPDLDEGFDQLFYVLIDPESGETLVKEWNNEI